MNHELSNKMSTAVKVCDFLEAHPFGNTPGDQVAAEYVAKVNRARILFTQQQAGEVAAAASTQYRKGLQHLIVTVPARHVAKISQAVAAAHPEITAGHGVSALSRSQPEFVAKVEVMLQEAQANREVYIQHGLTEEGLEELEKLLAAYKESISQSNAARRAHTGANRELRELGRELIRMLGQLDGIMVYRLRNQPELQGAWESARNVAWPAPQPKVESPATGGEQSA